MANDWWDYLRADIREDDDDLSHHGILGQKWGFRRFQDELGHLTPEGVERYKKISKKHSKLESKYSKRISKASNLIKKADKARENYNFDRADKLDRKVYKTSKKAAKLSSRIESTKAEMNYLEGIKLKDITNGEIANAQEFVKQLMKGNIDGESLWLDMEDK